MADMLLVFFLLMIIGSGILTIITFGKIGQNLADIKQSVNFMSATLDKKLYRDEQKRKVANEQNNTQ